MGDNANLIMFRLLKLQEQTGYNIIQENGQRRFGPPPDWTGPPPPRGCEVFVGKLPRNIFEDQLVPVFSRVGKIYDLRLMMDFSGSNRGFAFVTYTCREDAAAAVRELNGVEVLPGRHIGVAKSVDNCRLFFGGIPQTKTKEEVREELAKRVSGIVDVIVYKNCFDRRRNRGFAFVEFESHRAASMARRALTPGVVRLWDHDVLINWAEPEPTVDDDLMKQVKVLFVRNFFIGTTAEMIERLFETAINDKIEKVKKIYDYAFIHFYERKHAELAMAKLQNVEVDGNNIEIRFAKPVDQDLYRIQKSFKGNAKFNKNLNLTHTLLLYKRHLEKREFENDGENDIQPGGPAAGHSGTDRSSNLRSRVSNDNYSIAPAKLEAICNSYRWTQPIYKYQQVVDHTETISWIGHVELPSVGLPLLTVPSPIGPLVTRVCTTTSEARNEAAAMMLRCIKALQVNMETSQASLPVYPHISPPVPNYCFPYDYFNTPQHTPPTPLPMPVAIPHMYQWYDNIWL